MKYCTTIFFAFIGLLVTYVLLLSISALLVNGNREYTNHSKFYRCLLNSGVVLAVFLCRIRVRLSGEEKLPDGRFLLVSDHRSNFDPIVTWHVLKSRDISFISKQENFAIPWFGRIIRKCCCLSIDRENPRNALVTIQKAADLIKDNQVSVGVYPEGTRSKSGELLPFHNGVLKIAQKAGVPIVIVAVTGTEFIHKNCPWHRTNVYVDIIDVIPAEEVMSERTSELGQRIHKELNFHLSKDHTYETIHSI